MHAKPSIPYRILAVFLWPIMRLLHRYNATGIENLPDGGFVLAANHASNFDPWPLALAISGPHQVRFMAKAELFWPPLSWVIETMGGFRVRRGEPDREAIATARRLAREGNVIGMFLEGTRRTKGALKRRDAASHAGAARIALAAGVPLVPAAISGTDDLSHLKQQKVAYGKPIRLDDLEGLGRKEAARVATERLMEAISELEAELE
jgi:1-acyl-sn-glycerol-3-phosphate acyltransferase